MLQSDSFELHFVGASEAALSVADQLTGLEQELRTDLGAEALGPELTLVYLHPTTDSFVAATGQPRWSAGVTRGRRIDLQPRSLLERRGAWLEALRHELAHRWLDRLSHGRCPRWLQEGWALGFGGVESVAHATPFTGTTLADLEQSLAPNASRRQLQSASLAAYRLVQDLERSQPGFTRTYCAALAEAASVSALQDLASSRLRSNSMASP